MKTILRAALIALVFGTMAEAAPAGQSTNRLESAPSNRPTNLLEPMPSTPAANRTSKDGNVYKYPEVYAPATGASEIVVGPQQVASICDPSRKSSKDLPLPAIRVSVTGKDGKPVPGVEVRLGLKGNKKNAKVVRLKGATAADGSFSVRPEGSHRMQKVAIDLAWDGGYKIVGVDLTPDEGKWKMSKAPIKNGVTGDDEGSCKNLFTFEQQGADSSGRPSYRLKLAQPATLLECKSVEYGIDRKADQLVRVDAIGTRDINAGDKNMYSAADEAKIGVEAATKFDAELELVQDQAIVSYVKGVLQKVVANSDAPNMPINLRVVNTKDVNAFCAAGGNVYVFTGLISAAQDEAQLAGVLAHELSHAIARHVTEAATRQSKAQIGTAIGAIVVGQAAGVGAGAQDALLRGSLTAAGVYGMKYDRRLESESDLLGEQYLWKAGWDPEAIARFFEVLSKMSNGEPPQMLSTHPSHEHRIENGIHWARAFLPPKDRWLVSTKAFEDCKKRVLALPPPKKKPPAN